MRFVDAIVILRKSNKIHESILQRMERILKLKCGIKMDKIKTYVVISSRWKRETLTQNYDRKKFEKLKNLNNLRSKIIENGKKVKMKLKIE